MTRYLGRGIYFMKQKTYSTAELWTNFKKSNHDQIFCFFKKTDLSNKCSQAMTSLFSLLVTSLTPIILSAFQLFCENFSLWNQLWPASCQIPAPFLLTSLLLPSLRCLIFTPHSLLIFTPLLIFIGVLWHYTVLSNHSRSLILLLPLNVHGALLVHPLETLLVLMDP